MSDGMREMRRSGMMTKRQTRDAERSAVSEAEQVAREKARRRAAKIEREEREKSLRKDIQNAKRELEASDARASLQEKRLRSEETIYYTMVQVSVKLKRRLDRLESMLRAL